MSGAQFQVLGADIGTTNGNDTYAKLLLHCDGANGSTTFVDFSGGGHSVTANNSAQVTTTNAKFGSGAATFAGGSNSCLTIPYSADFDPGTADFTIDFWLRTAGFHSIVVNSLFCAGALSGYYIAYDPQNHLLEWVDNVNGLGATGSSIATNTTVHVAVVRFGGTLTLYQGGAAQGNVTGYSGVSVSAAGGGVCIGDFYLNGGNSYTGLLDEIRFSKGIARWTTNFTPPTSAYS